MTTAIAACLAIWAVWIGAAAPTTTAATTPTDASSILPSAASIAGVPGSFSRAEEDGDGDGEDAPPADDDPTIDDPDGDPTDDTTINGDDAATTSPAITAVGNRRLRSVRRLEYVVACPIEICQTSVQAELRLPGGRTITLDSPIRHIREDLQRRFYLKIPRSDRKALKSAASRGRSVLVVARTVEWSGEEVVYGADVRTRLR